MEITIGDSLDIDDAKVVKSALLENPVLDCCDIGGIVRGFSEIDDLQVAKSSVGFPETIHVEIIGSDCCDISGINYAQVTKSAIEITYSTEVGNTVSDCCDMHGINDPQVAKSVAEIPETIQVEKPVSDCCDKVGVNDTYVGESVIEILETIEVQNLGSSCDIGGMMGGSSKIDDCHLDQFAKTLNEFAEDRVTKLEDCCDTSGISYAQVTKSVVEITYSIEVGNTVSECCDIHGINDVQVAKSASEILETIQVEKPVSDCCDKVGINDTYVAESVIEIPETIKVENTGSSCDKGGMMGGSSKAKTIEGLDQLAKTLNEFAEDRVIKLQDDHLSKTQDGINPSMDLCQIQTWRAAEFIQLPFQRDHTSSDELSSDIVIGVVDPEFYINYQTIEEGPFSQREINKLNRTWTAGTNAGFRLNKKVVAAKCFPLKNSKRWWTYVETHRHGTICATIACGNYVIGGYHGLRNGLFRGATSQAKVAFYLCARGNEGGCVSSTLLDAINDATQDHVDIMSLSTGHPIDTPPRGTKYELSVIGQGTLYAVLSGIVCCCAGGNYGYIPNNNAEEREKPRVLKVANFEPWELCVGSCNTLKCFSTNICLGDDQFIKGHSTNLFERTGKCPLIHLPKKFNPSRITTEEKETIEAETTLDPDKFRGKIILCRYALFDRDDKTVNEAKRVGAKGIIFFSSVPLWCDKRVFPLPAAAVSQERLNEITKYLKSQKEPTVEIFPTIEEDSNNNPVLMNFSSKGPNPREFDIIKPDICAPGQMVVPLCPTIVGQERIWTCSLETGTSMSTALVTGATSVLKSIHLDWSPAALISSVLTTADPIELIDDEDILGVGSGLINAKKAQEPGLVYDMDPMDYIRYLCYKELDFSALVKRAPHFADWIKKGNKEIIHPRELNLANLSAAFLENEKGYMFKRRLKNVGIPNSVYSCYVQHVEGLDIKPRPLELKFGEIGEVQEYEVDVQVVDWSKGGKYGFRTYIEWRHGNYQVRSHIFILKSWMFEPKPKPETSSSQAPD